jgi:hypothetical protein
MSGPATEEGALRLAALTREILDQLPDGMDLVMFFIADNGDSFEAQVAASAPPQVFAPVVRGWLERYDSGMASP